MSADTPFDRLSQRWSRRIDLLLTVGLMTQAVQREDIKTLPNQAVALQYDRPREAQWKREQRNRGKR